MQRQKYDAVVVGAGIAGIAAAYALSKTGAGRIALVENGPPLGLTSDKSTECYRNFWPGPDDAMLRLVSDSIERLMEHAERSRDQFLLRQRGYVFATARADEVDALAEQATQLEAFGGGRLRHHDGTGNGTAYAPSPTGGFDRSLDGADLITDRALIRGAFPYLSQDTIGVLHVRRCGALSAQQLGMYLLEEALDAGTELVVAEFTGIETTAGRLSGVNCRAEHGDLTLDADALVLSPGPHLKAAAGLAGSKLPVDVEKHIKISMADRLGVVPRDAPLIIWNDPIDLAWSAEEHEMLASMPETQRLVETFPAGVHGRPVGAGDQVLMYWTYDCEQMEQPEFPIEPDPYLPEVTLRGMAVLVPGLSAYLDPMPRPYVDGGYYTKAPDNRPLIGPLGVPGTYVCGAFSGYGIMASCAAGDLLAAHVLGRDLPDYAGAFDVTRFDDPAYVARIADLTTSGQL
ncbi:MAG: NAD(P)/FAD-dependent oxidoreductase [Hyphomicrobiaceae bacterium]